MEEQKQAEVVTIKEAVDKVKTWLTEKDFEKAKQGCEEILSVEKDNPEVKSLLEKVNKELGIKTEQPAVQTVQQPKIEAVTTTPVAPVQETKPATSGKSHIGLIILAIILLLIIGGLVFAFIKGWLNPAFEWILGLLGM